MVPKFKVGDEVQSASDPNRMGTVVEICEVHAGVQWYRVNLGAAGRPKMDELDLRLFIPDRTPGENLLHGNIDGYQGFQRLITYQRLLREHPLRNNIYAFNASRTRLYHYQFKPLLKFLDSPKSRLLIADEVGLGKTIEAGLILTELRARQTVDRVLVVCPANLTDKWRMELRNRFGEEFRILKAQAFREFLKDYEEYPVGTRLNGIISIETIRSKRILEELEALTPNFDLVIVDEAHHMRNFGRKQRKAGVVLNAGAESMLFLTATPIQLGNQDLFSLLNILDEEEFPDQYTAELRFQQNEPIIKAQTCVSQIPPKFSAAINFLKSIEVAASTRKKPEYQELLSKLEQARKEEQDDDRLRRTILESQRLLAQLNLLGHIFTRTRKRDVATFRSVRKAYSNPIELTSIERKFYDAVTEYVISESEKRMHSPLIQAWILQTPQRRMASSIPAMVEYYKKRLSLSAKDLSEDIDFIDEAEEANDSSPIAGDPETRLRSILQRWPDNPCDTKYDKLIAILKDLRDREGPLKVMIFAFFKDTLRYLHRRLANDGFKSLIISGDVVPSERGPLIEKFRTKSKYEILLSSKVGSEGLDFQFCNTLFNYDLPWNPMEVEQRIGRLDRLGQESEVIRIYNFYIANTIEQKIIERLYKRIGIFERSIGELEMILGDILGTIERDILSKKLSPDELEELIEQKERAILARKDALEELEEKAAEFIGTDKFFDEEVQRIKDRRRYITGEQLRRFIVDFIRIRCPRTRLEYDSKTNLGELQLDDEFLKLITRYDVGRTTYHTGTLKITFDSQTAFDHSHIEFINVLHPIAQCIAEYYKDEKGIQSNAHMICLRTKTLEPGLYYYFIYRLRVHAARGRNTIETIFLKQSFEQACDEEQAETVFGEMVERGQNTSNGDLTLDQTQVHKACRRAEQIFQTRISRIRAEVEKSNDSFIQRRLESLQTSYTKNIKNKQDQLAKGELGKKDVRYLRLLRSTINRLRRELETKEMGLESLRKIQVEYDEISAGVLQVIVGTEHNPHK